MRDLAVGTPCFVLALVLVACGGDDDAGAAGGAGNAGAAGAAQFWEGPYAACTADSTHHAGEDCRSCHEGAFAVAGTVYKMGVAAEGVQVGIRTLNNNVVTACSGPEGNFHAVSAQAIDYDKAEIRIRNAEGEVTGHPAGGPSRASCNMCHKALHQLQAP